MTVTNLIKELKMKIKVNDVEIKIGLQKYNVDVLESLIKELRSQPIGGQGTDSFCDILRKEVLEQQGISLPTIIRLSKRCHTGGTWTKGEPTANKISKLLFNEILPRLD